MKREEEKKKFVNEKKNKLQNYYTLEWGEERDTKRIHIHTLECNETEKKREERNNNNIDYANKINTTAITLATKTRRRKRTQNENKNNY